MGEHSPNDVISFIPQLMALKDSVSAPVVRPSSNNVVEIKRLLDAGFYNFSVPFVESVDEAQRAVRLHPLSAAWYSWRLGVAAQQPVTVPCPITSRASTTRFA